MKCAIAKTEKYINRADKEQHTSMNKENQKMSSDINRHERKSGKKFLTVFPGICLTVSILLELTANLSKDFAVFFTENVFTIITLPLAFISGLFPFSVGELLLYLLVLIILIFIPLLVIFCINHTRYFIYYLKTLWFLLGIYSLIMVTNCFILYQTPPMQAIREVSDEDTELLIELRDKIVVKANELAVTINSAEANFTDDNSVDKGTTVEAAADRNSTDKISIDKNSTVEPRSGADSTDQNPAIEKYSGKNSRTELSGKELSRARLSEAAIDTLHTLASTDDDYSRLSGYYPDFKYFNNPAFFSQQYILGYYFPFSMEANINSIMYYTNFPHCICHEYAHLKGYIREDEANFIAFLACMNSDDDYFQYSALLSVVGYFDNDFYKAINKEKDIYLSHPQISEQVIEDDQFLTKEAWNWVDDHSFLDTETVRKASNSFTTTVLTTNGVSDGLKSYSRVVGLLLEYYKEHPDFLDNY